MGETCKMSLCASDYGGCIERTSAHLGDLYLLDDDDEDRGTFKDLHGGDLHETFDVHHTLYQEPLVASDFYNKAVRIIGEVLGEGGFGTAFRCEFRGVEYVIKLPNHMLAGRYIVFDKAGFLVDGSIDRGIAKNKGKMERNFEIECKFNEMALDSYTHRKLRNHETGARLIGANYDAYVEIKKELDTMKLHKGFEHIHKIFGFVSGVPAIFSEPCSGSLQGLIDADSGIFLGGYATKLSYQWLELAKQIGHAIEYLKDIARIVHLDIKPGNILYNESKNENPKTAFTWKLSDFGLCQAWDDDSGYTATYLVGTTMYIPGILKETKKKQGRVSFNAYECSLHSYMATLIMSIKFDIPRAEGYLEDKFNALGATAASAASAASAAAEYCDDVVGYVNCVKDVWSFFRTAKINGGFCLCHDGSRDYVSGELAQMLFSELSEKPNIFNSLMDSINLELSKRQGAGMAAMKEETPDDGLMLLAAAAARRQRSSSHNEGLGRASQRTRR